MKNFTVEEINLMCCFNTSSRKRLIDDMKSVTLNDMDGEIAELMYKTVRKLEAMTDAEFDELYIMPDGIIKGCLQLFDVCPRLFHRRQFHFLGKL